MGKLTIGSGRHSIVMDDKLERWVRAYSSEVVPGLIDEIERETESVYKAAKGRWPVSDPSRWSAKRKASQPYHSRDGLRREVRYDPNANAIDGRIANTAWWAKYVSVWYLHGKNAYVELLRKPLGKAQDRIADKALDILISAWRRG